MSEILFIAVDPVILSLIENLQQRVEPGIVLESNYTSGIKKIFDARPAIVFLQHKIGEMTCDKLANQVKMLLDDETVPLVLLSDETAMSCGVGSTYVACFDLCLPLGELCRQIQELLRTLPQIGWKESAAPEPEEPQPETTLEITLPADATGFFQPFPWKEEDAVSPLAELEGNAVPLTGLGEIPLSGLADPQFLSGFLEDQFVIEPIPRFIHPEEAQPTHREPVPPPEEAQSTLREPQPTPRVAQPAPREPQPTPEPALAAKDPFQDFHRIEKENPTRVFGSMFDSRDEPSCAVPAGRVPQSRKAAAASSPGAVAASPKAPPPPPVQPPSAPAAETPQAEFPSDELPEAVVAALGIKEKPHRYFRVLVAGLLLVLGAALSLDLFFARRPVSRELPPGIRELDAQLNARPAPAPVAAPQLPQFVPQVAPDPNYAAGHPGWERYQADDLEYLVYREGGSVRAVQVLSKRHGVITDPLLKTCIRIGSGFDQFTVKKIETRSGIQIATGSLQNGGELQVYRIIPEGEIRGFVMTYPNGNQATPGARK